MVQVCRQCGKTFEATSAAAGAVCPACDPTGARPVPAPVPSRSYGKDIVIAVLVLALLGLLVWLFLRPGEQHARDIVFGDLGRRTTLSNGVVGGAAAGAPGASGEQGAGGGVGGAGRAAATKPASATSGPDQLTADQRAPNTLQGNNQSAADVASGSAGAPSGPGTRPGDSGSRSPGTGSGPPDNASPGNSRSHSSSPSSSQSSSATGGSSPTSTPAPTPPLSPPPPAPGNPPSATSSYERRTRSAPFVETLPPDPDNKDSTVELLAAAKATAAAPTLPRTADLLGNDGGIGRMFDAQSGSNVVFILDNSMSMMTNGKSFSARQELVRTLQSMNPGQTFYVLLFHSGGYEGMPSLSPVPATPENVRAMTNWLFAVGHRTGADPTKAMLRALGLAPAPDTVWLLSGSALPDKVIDNIREANASVNARINTIGFYTRDGEQGMRQIADENRGVYRFVPPPNPSAP